jgi:hypothetical protein
MKDRAEWVRQATQTRKERISALNEARKARESPWKVQQEPEGYSYQAMVDQMLEDLCRINPEWRIRKEEALRVSLGLSLFWFLTGRRWRVY